MNILAFSKFLQKKNLISDENFAHIRNIATKEELISFLKSISLMNSEKEIYEFIAKSLGVEFIENVEELEIPKEVISLLNSETALKYLALPIKVDFNGVHIALSDPFDYEIIDNLRFLLEKEIILVIVSSEQLEKKLDGIYGASKSSEITDKMKNSTKIEDKENGENFAIIDYVDNILALAVKEKAADIHFEPFENDFKIRYRVDGALLETQAPPISLAKSMISRIKVMANMNIAENRLPQDGRIIENISGKDIEFRVSSLPTQHGESVVLRVLDSSAEHATLENIGLPNTIYEQICELIKIPNGIFIVTGPTGSGKTTTLYSVLKKINSISKKILTIEDPVEYEIEGIVQINTHEEIDFTFPIALRSFLRQDPDCIMVGEIRDLDTTNTAIQASLTGHLVLSTLHTNDAPSSITRLIDIGAEPFLVANSLRGILAQRLVRKICQHCKTSYEPNTKILNRLGISSQDIKKKVFYTGKGCEKCHKTGYLGRQGLFELLIINEEISELISERASSIIIKEKANEIGMISLREDGLRNIYNGITTIEEVLKYT